MSLLWSTAGILALLIPGVAFVLLNHSADYFTRVARATTPLRQFVAIVAVATLIHGFLFFLLTRVPVCSNLGFLGRCIDVQLLLETVRFFSVPESGDTARLASVIQRDAVWGLWYLTVATILGGGAGIVYSRSVVLGPAEALAQYPWAYLISPAPAKSVWKTIKRLLGLDDVRYPYFANVVTKIKENENILVYRGEIEDFGIGRSGELRYLALSAPERCYLQLEGDGAAIDHDWHTIGSSSEADSGQYPTTGRHLFFVEGRDVEHVVFSSSETGIAATEEEVEEVSEDVAALVREWAKLRNSSSHPSGSDN